MATFNQVIFNKDFNTSYEDGFSYSLGRSDCVVFDGTNYYLTIGAPYKYVSTLANVGKVYNYQRISGTWVLQQQINPPVNYNIGHFGLTSSLYYKPANLSAANFFQVIAEPFANIGGSQNGNVHLYSANSFNAMSRYQTVTSPKSNSGYFGHSVALTALPLSAFFLITERGINGGSGTAPGSAYIYTVNSDNQTISLRKPIYCQSSTQGTFGYRGLFCDDLIVITDDERDYNSFSTAGTAFYYSWDPNNLNSGLNSPKKLDRSQILSSQKYGAALAYNSGILAVGAPGLRGTFQGKVWLYRKSGANLFEVRYLEAANPSTGWSVGQSDCYGFSVDMVRRFPTGDNLNIYVGCPYFEPGIQRRGAVFCYNYSLSANTCTFNNIVSLDWDESPSIPGNSFGYSIHADSNFTFVGAGNSQAALLPVSAASLAYVYNADNIMNSDPVNLFYEAVLVTQPYVFTDTITCFPPFPANLPENTTTRIAASAIGYPPPTYQWIKDGFNIPLGNQRVYTFLSNLFDDGLYAVSAFNAINHYQNTDRLSNTIYINITSSAPVANNQKLPEDSNFISIGAYGAGSPNLYRSINQFIKNYNSIGNASPNSSLTTREINFMTLDTKPATGVDNPNNSFVVVMKNQVEMGTTNVPLYGALKNYQPTGTGGTFRPTRMSEFKGSYKWYSPWFNIYYSSNSAPGCVNCQTTDRTNKGTLTIQGTNNVETNIFYVQITPAPLGGIPSGWRIASPTVTYQNVVNNGNTFPPFGGTQAYTIYLMDENGYGITQNVAALQRVFTATYP